MFLCIGVFEGFLAAEFRGIGTDWGKWVFGLGDWWCIFLLGSFIKFGEQGFCMREVDCFSLSRIEGVSSLSFFSKKGLSNLVAYVLLISITISLSFMVYGWLKFYVERGEVEECPDNVNIVIDGYACSSGAGGNLTVRLRNRGFFNIDGYILRVHNRSDAEFGFYVLEENNTLMKTGENRTRVYNFPTVPDGLTDVTFVDVQPFLKDGEKISCKAYSSQRITCV